MTIYWDSCFPAANPPHERSDLGRIGADCLLADCMLRMSASMA